MASHRLCTRLQLRLCFGFKRHKFTIGHRHGRGAPPRHEQLLPPAVHQPLDMASRVTLRVTRAQQCAFDLILLHCEPEYKTQIQSFARGCGDRYRRELSLSQSVTRLGAWKELCRQETIPQEHLQGHAARCRVGERVTTPWSMYH